MVQDTIGTTTIRITLPIAAATAENRRTAQPPRATYSLAAVSRRTAFCRPCYSQQLSTALSCMPITLMSEPQNSKPLGIVFWAAPIALQRSME